MSEADLMDHVREGRVQTAFLWTQIIFVHFALLAGIYYFLNQARLPLKLAAFGVYTLGFLALVSFVVIEHRVAMAVHRSLAQLGETRALSEAALSFLEGYPRFGVMVQLLGSAVAVLLWLTILYFLFFYRVSKPPPP